MKLVDKLFVAGVALTSVIWFAACKTDIMIPPPPGLEGAYLGWLRITNNYGNGQTMRVDSQIIVCRFLTGGKYNYHDTLTDTIKFCNVAGDYTYNEDKLNLTPTDTGVEVCNPADIPHGSGFLVRRTDDSLFLTQSLRSAPDYRLTQFILKKI